MTTQDRTYNGWSTYETWLVNLWIQNDQALYAVLHDKVVSSADLYSAREVLKAWLDNEYDLFVEVLGQNGLFQDLLKGALSEVNWYEIAKNWRGEE